MDVVINYWAVLVSAVASVVLGFIWYGPLFGKQWMALNGMTMPDPKPKMSAMTNPMIISIIGASFMSWMTAFALGMASQTAGFTTACVLIVVASNWLGFIVPVSLNSVAWEQKSWKLFAINTGYWLVYGIISGYILFGWR